MSGAFIFRIYLHLVLWCEINFHLDYHPRLRFSLHYRLGEIISYYHDRLEGK